MRFIQESFVLRGEHYFVHVNIIVYVIMVLPASLFCLIFF